MAAEPRGSTTIDVIIPARNEARYLADCLASLAEQRYPLDAVTVYLVDNGSIDDTVAIARGFHKNDLRVRVLEQPRRGPAASRNLAISQGNGELLALLDAHCIVEPDWLGALAARFDDPQIGGCQAKIVSRATSPRVQRYLERSGELSNERVLDDTVLGKRNLYPWILSGNSMYRRSAVAAAGGFDENLRACEDVDLAWRVVLSGYRLAYEPTSVAVHYDTNTWWRFVRKGLGYGAGAAELSHRYEPHGARNKFAPATAWTTSIDRSLSALFYSVGYRMKNARMRLGIDAAPAQQPQTAVPASFRPWFAWSDKQRVRIGDRAIYWLRDDGDPQAVVVHMPSHSRLVLEGAANEIWRSLAEQRSRNDAVARLSKHYGISPVTAGADIDDFVEELVAGGFIDRQSA